MFEKMKFKTLEGYQFLLLLFLIKPSHFSSLLINKTDNKAAGQHKTMCFSMLTQFQIKTIHNSLINLYLTPQVMNNCR